MDVSFIIPNHRNVRSETCCFIEARQSLIKPTKFFKRRPAVAVSGDKIREKR